MTAQPLLTATGPAAHDWIVELRDEQASFPGVRVPGAALETAAARFCDVLFDGTLFDRAELVAAVASPIPGPTDADLLTAAYRKWGSDLCRRLKGHFALVIWDREQRRLIAIRDPLGAHPLFYARGAGGRILVSPSLDALARHPSVRRTINRAAIADHLCHRWPSHTETFYRDIDRVPPGSRLIVTANDVVVDRYWDPAPLGEPVNWISPGELEEFDQRLERAVERALSHGRAGIFLSGGLDSISVAALAADLARQNGHAPPVALSLGFPHAECDEEHVQRGVAATLAVEQEFIPFFQALPSGALLGPALEFTRRAPAPILNTWSPAYTELARRGRERGVRVIMTGSGGDEWLSVSPYILADLLRQADIAGVARVLVSWKLSYHMSPWQVLRGTFWTYGVRPLAGLALHRIAPRAWHRNRVERLQRTTRPWVAPDLSLRKELHQRTADMVTPADPPGGFYFQEVRAGLDHPLTSMELEEMFEMGRRLDVRFHHPYWDVDVVDMLYRTPPALLLRHGRAKGLVRDTVARRFPALGLDRQKKVVGTSFFKSVLRNEMPALWNTSGGARRLAELGIIDPGPAEAMVEASLADFTRESLIRVWELLNFEAWIASHA